MNSHTAIPDTAAANVQAFSKRGMQRDDGHLAQDGAEILQLVAAHSTDDSVHVHYATDFRNEWTNEEEIRQIREEHPDHLFLYVSGVSARTRAYGSQYRMYGSIRTWIGTVLDDAAVFGPQRLFPGFGSFPSKRRSVECRIFGVRYVGWYYESSGDYCRLRKAKQQKRGK